MPMFAYTARDEAGKAVAGSIPAETIQEATRQIRAGGVYPTSVTPVGGPTSETAGGTAANGRGGVRISRAELIQLSQQLAIMVETGVTLAEALDCVNTQSGSANLKALLSDLSTQVQSGCDFSKALARHPRSFPRIFVALVRAAEKTGMLSKFITRATAYLREEQETSRRVKGALTYPAIMLAFAMTTTIFLLAFVLPRFTAIYASKGAALPLPTKILMAMSNAVISHWLLLLGGAAALVAGGYAILSTEAGRRAWHATQLRLPLLGAMFRKLHLSRGLRMIGTMAGAGVNLVDCVGTAHDLCGNVYFRELWHDVGEKITHGRQMSEPLAASKLVPRSVAQMIHSAEKSGRMAQVTEQVAGFAEQELKEKIAELTRYIEPAMIIVMGIIIGGVSLALMLPIFTISRVVAQ